MAHRIERLALAVAGSMIGLTAAAQEPPLRLDPIRVDGTTDVGNVHISEQAISDRAPQTMRQLFSGETIITSGGAIPVANKTRVHGIEENQLSVTIDGARQTAGPFHHSANTLFDPSMLKAVRVAPGVATADSGPRALAGSIAYEIVDARDLLDVGEYFGAFGKTTYETNGETWTPSLSMYGRPGNFEYLLYGTYANGNDFEDGSGEKLEGSGADFESFLTKAAYTTDNDHRFELSASLSNDDSDRQLRPNFGGIVGQPIVLNDYKLESRNLSLTYRDESIEGWFAPEVQLAYGSIEVKNQIVKGEAETFNGKAQNVFDIGFGTINAGVDFLADEAQGGGRPDTAEEKGRNVGTFAQARLEVTEDLSVSFGGRLDYAWFEGQDGSTFDDVGPSGNIAAQYDVLDWLTLEAGYSHVWGGYAIGEAAIINFQGPWVYDGLSPSKSNNYRVGAVAEWQGWSAGAWLFRTEIDGAQAIQFVQRGQGFDLRSQGVDARLGYTFEKGYAELNYTYADVKQDGDTPTTTNDYLGIPAGHLFGLTAAYDVWEGARIGATGEFALQNNDTDGLAGAQGTTLQGLDSYEVLNLFAEYTPPQFPSLNLRLDVFNLFDKTYLDRSSNGGGQDALIVPLNEPGRSFRIGVTLTF